MLCADLEDAAMLGDDVLALHPEYIEFRELEGRRAIREARGSGVKLQCGGCRRFIRSRSETCGCGFTNDVQGRRNQGGYLGLPADNQERDLIPF